MWAFTQGFDIFFLTCFIEPNIQIMNSTQVVHEQIGRNRQTF